MNAIIKFKLGYLRAHYVQTQKYVPRASPSVCYEVNLFMENNNFARIINFDSAEVFIINILFRFLILRGTLPIPCN